MAARLRLSDLTPEQRRTFGFRSAPAKSAGSKRYDALRCNTCGEQVPGQTAMERHRDATGHRRFECIAGVGLVSVPAVPEPDSLAADPPAEIWPAIRSWAPGCDDINVVDEVRARVAAYGVYQARKSNNMQREIAATERTLEVRVGELLGPPARDHDRTLGAKSVMADLSKDERHEFRKMASDPAAVEDVIERSTDETPASRRQVLSEIERRRQAKAEADGTRRCEALPIFGGARPSRAEGGQGPSSEELERSAEFRGAVNRARTRRERTRRKAS